jgi:hypothetical protein
MSECVAKRNCLGLVSTQRFFVLGTYLGLANRWPYLLIPFYKLADLIPATRAGARRLGLVTIQQMINALVYSIENPSQGQCVLDPQSIRAAIQLPVAEQRAASR